MNSRPFGSCANLVEEPFEGQAGLDGVLHQERAAAWLGVHPRTSMNAPAARFVEPSAGNRAAARRMAWSATRVFEGVNAVPEQEQKRTQRKDGGAEGGDDAGQVTSSEKGEKLKGEMDDILDEIDSVLEENAEEFVKSYVQKGGE